MTAPEADGFPARGAAPLGGGGLGARLGVSVAVQPVVGTGPAAETLAGRLAAASALTDLGGPGVVVGRAADGRPMWPDGWTGSISHRDDLAVAVVAPTTAVAAVGIDVERARALTARDAELVLAPSERRLLAGHADPDAASTTLWTAKEAAFKAWSTALGGLPDVDPVEIEVVLQPALQVRATGRLARRVVPVGPLAGVALADRDWVLALVVAPAARLRRERPSAG